VAGVALSIKYDDRELKALLTGLKSRTKNLTPVMRIIGEIVRTSVVRNFEQGGRPEKWPKSKKEKGRTLILTGRLMKSYKSKAYPDRSVTGSNVVYAAIQHFGGKAGRGRKVTIPARPHVMVQDEDWREIKDAVLDYITGGAK
jgi:phage virion morphogenesis protein